MSADGGPTGAPPAMGHGRDEPLRILAIGGTRFVGRHLVAEALGRGHEVTLVHRGGGHDPFPASEHPHVEHRHGDRDHDLPALLAEGQWDATVDLCAYLPEQVDALAAALGGRGGRHLLVSSVSAYARPPGPGLTEDAALAVPPPPGTTEITDATYGGLKVACELRARAHHRDLLVIRPTYVIGPDDYTWRLPAWIARISRGGEVLCPGPAGAPMQVIDARDQARFAVDLLERGAAGTFHTAWPRPPWSFADLLESVASVVAPAGTRLVWVDRAFVEEEGLTAEEVPLWPGGDDDADVLAADPSRALAAGLAPRPVADSLADTAAWLDRVGLPAGWGLEPGRERDLLDRWGHRRP